MSTGVRSTPCVGICSTTYGDLVCRGCKRFAHEIVAWNSYTQDQRDRVWRRLFELRDQATALHVTVSNAQVLRDAGLAARLVRQADMSLLTLGYEMLRRRARELESVEQVGLRPLHDEVSHPVAVRDAIDAEFHLRSMAHFERSFHTPVE